MNLPLPPSAFARESRLLLRQLAQSKRRLNRSTAGEWYLTGKRKKAVPDRLVAEMIARSLLGELPDGTFAPTIAGNRLVMATSRDSSLLAQHALVSPPAAPQSPQVNRTECAVHWLANRSDKSGKPLLSAIQLAAAERIRIDYEMAGLGTRVTVNWDIAESNDGYRLPRIEPAERAVAAKARFFSAIEAVGEELSGVVFEVCCLAAGIEQAERRLRLPSRSGRVVLQLALTALARHYGLASPGRKAHVASVLRSWAMPGFRPELDN